MNKLHSAKKFLNDHKVPILATIAVTSTTIMLVQNRGITNVNNFLKDHNLFDEYYRPED